jgi:hypothetical protein
MKISSLAVLAAIVCAATAARTNAAVVVNYDTGVVNQTTALTAFSTSGDQMSGMLVHATYANGSSADAVWVATGVGAGQAASVSGYVLLESGDTFNNIWTLRNDYTSPLTSLSIDAGPGDTVFDTIALGDIEGTSGSARGLSFTADSSWNIVATYSDAVALTGFAPVGDLFRRLTIQFVDGLAVDSRLTFNADTDNALIPDDITPVVPLPAAVWSGGLLLGAFGLTKKLRRR